MLFPPLVHRAPLTPIINTLYTRIPSFLGLMRSHAFAIHPITVSDRISFLDMSLFNSVMRQAFHSFAANSVVHEPSAFVTVKVVMNDRAPVKIMHPRRRHMIGPFMSAHPEK